MRNCYISLTSILLIACGGSSSGPGEGDADAAASSGVTYYRDVKPILDAKCGNCHYDGGIAPFSVTSYEQARTHAGASKLAIEQGTMPPWPPDNECADYDGARSLSDAQKATFMTWFDTGMAEGDPQSPGAPLPVDRPTLARVDATVEMAESYVPRTTSDYFDDYRCFVVPWTELETTYVTGIRVLPGNPAVVHHVIAFIAQPGDAGTYADLDAAEAGPGYSCFGGTGGPAQEWLGGWAPGDDSTLMPAGVGLEVPPGAVIVMQVHYNTLGVAMDAEVRPDLTRIEMQLESEVEKVARIMPWASPQWLGGGMSIPANDDDVMHSFAYDPNVVFGSNSLQVYSASLHMHLLGSNGVTSIERADGTSECLLDIDDWDFDWQGEYGFAEPKVINRGDQLRLECHWDNSAANQPMTNGEQLPPRNVNWGEGSTDEMCLGVYLVVPL